MPIIKKRKFKNLSSLVNYHNMYGDLHFKNAEYSIKELMFMKALCETPVQPLCLDEEDLELYGLKGQDLQTNIARNSKIRHCLNNGKPAKVHALICSLIQEKQENSYKSRNFWIPVIVSIIGIIISVIQFYFK